MTKKQSKISKAIATVNPDLPPAFTKAFEGAIQGLTGVVQSSPQDLAVSWLRIAQRVIRGHKLASVSAEFEILRKKGETTEEYLTSMQGQYTLIELLDFLENHQVDEYVFQVMKRIFLIAATQKEDVIVQQYMQIAKNLTGGEVMVLEAAFGIVTKPDWHSSFIGPGSIAEDQWASVIAYRSGLQYADLVKIHAETLVTKKMLNGKGESSLTGHDTPLGEHMRLTDLGYGFCKYIARYEELTK